MEKLKYIYDDEHGVTCYDKYFSYLGDVAPAMPPVLAEFASRVSNYDLRSADTLHDAWLKSLDVSKSYLDGPETVSKVSISLLHQSHAGIIDLTYSEVSSLACALQPSRWPTAPVDLITHEFDVVGPDRYRHFIQFDRDVWIETIFGGFDYVRRVID